jgi:hypothetical protein
MFGDDVVELVDMVELCISRDFLQCCKTKQRHTYHHCSNNESSTKMDTHIVRIPRTTIHDPRSTIHDPRIYFHWSRISKAFFGRRQSEPNTVYRVRMLSSGS